MKPEQVEEFFRRLAAKLPEPKTELEYINPYTLLVAVVLSAQATDVGVNKATKRLFAGGRHAGEDGGAGRGGAQGAHQDDRAVQHQGQERHRAVAASWSSSMAARCRATREALEALPGVGRKTANVVLNVAFGEATIAVDTHIFRVGNRTGLAPGKTPLEVETEAREGVPRALQAARASLADPARALYVQGARAGLPGLRRARSVRLQGKDGGEL